MLRCLSIVDFYGWQLIFSTDRWLLTLCCTMYHNNNACSRGLMLRLDVELIIWSCYGVWTLISLCTTTICTFYYCSCAICSTEIYCLARVTSCLVTWRRDVIARCPWGTAVGARFRDVITTPPVIDSVVKGNIRRHFGCWTSGTSHQWRCVCSQWLMTKLCRARLVRCNCNV